MHRDNLLFEGNQVGLIDFDDCCWGYYAYDVASLLDSFRRRVSSPEAYPDAREAFLDGYTSAFGPLEDATETLPACKALRDAVTLQFVLGSVNESVLAWAPTRINELIDHIDGYCEGRRNQV